MPNEIDKNSAISKVRHSLAHVLAHAVKEKYPHVKVATGPATENGFYYDFDFSGREGDKGIPKEEDLPEIEERMREIVKAGFEPTQESVSLEEALARFKDEPYKTEVLKDKGRKSEKGSDSISLYTIGDFVDPCSGPHVASSKDIAPDGFKLERIAGAYWRGDEKNPMLTRIYGLAFESKEALALYEEQLEEAKKRDHRKLGKELDLFTFSDLVGPGLPLWTPKGTIFRRELDAFVTGLRLKNGYQLVTIPHIAKKELYETSGHWNKYSEDLFKVSAKEGDEHEGYVLKPMNCPHHTQIFDAAPRSYRVMPQRYAETTMVYRAEQSGELSGLTRVLSITQDDAHVFCRESQLENEIKMIWDMVDEFYGTFGFELEVSLSFHDPEKKDEYLGSEEVWENSEAIMKKIAEERGANFFLDLGEAAFYGPKLDFIGKDSIGRKHQVATIQLDRNQPERFDLNCVNEQGEKERVVMIHAAIAGSLERFGAVLIEHLAGSFPLWLSPVQVKVLTVSEKQAAYASEVRDALLTQDIRVELDESSESLGKKIRNAKQEKVPYFLVIGDKEVESATVTLESRNGESTSLSADDLIARLKSEIDSRSIG